MTKFEFSVPHHGRETHGFAVLPDADQKAGAKFPLVIFSHGYNGHETDFAGTADYFAANGVAAASITFSGGSTRDASGFPTTSMTIYTECEDLSAVIEYLTADGSFDGLFLFGASMGGLVSAMTARALGDERVRGLCLLFPALCISDNWNAAFPDAADIPETVELWGMTLGRGFFLSMHGKNLADGVGEYGGDVLIMHGDRDPIVNVSYGERVAEEYENAQLEVFAGEGHGFSHDANLRMEGMTLSFVHRISRKKKG